MVRRKIFLRNRRALSPIFATVLLSAIIILFGSIAYYFASNITTASTNNYVSSVSDSQQAISESLAFENVVYTSSAPASMTIYVLNCGMANNLQINTLFIYDANHSMIGSPYSGSQISQLGSVVGGTPIIGNSLNVGQEGYFTVTLSGPALIRGSAYTIHLITQSGSAFDYDFIP
jgi:hypothetical protein